MKTKNLAIITFIFFWFISPSIWGWAPTSSSNFGSGDSAMDLDWEYPGGFAN